jgi:hypothetical protein
MLLRKPARRASVLLTALFLLCAIAVCGSAFWALAPTDHAANIRSQTNEILVPVLVLDKSRALKSHHMQWVDWRTQLAASGDKTWDSLAVANLRKADFQLYQDGNEEEIQSVTLERKDSAEYLATTFGRYWQAAGVGGGTWTVPDWFPLSNNVTLELANGEHIYHPVFDSYKEQLYGYADGGGAPATALRSKSPSSGFLNLPPLPWYMIAYAPAASAPGTCHQITVKVDRSDTLVYSRSEYCDASESAADAIANAKLGARLTADLLSKKKGSLPVRITAIPVFTPTGASRIRLFVAAKLDAMFIDCNSFMDGSGIVGLIYSENGTLVQRFSDGLFYAPGRNSLYWDTEWFTPGTWPGRMACSDVFYEPTRYQTQLNLPPGAYQLKVGLWNGQKFGRAEVPLTVDRYDPTKLAIGGLALVRSFGTVGPNSKVLPSSLADRYPPLIAKGIEVVPAANTRFTSDGPVNFYFQVYEQQKSAARQATVVVHLQIRNAKTGQIVEQAQPLNAASFVTPGNPVIPIVSAIDIATLARGSYELQAQATDSTGATTPWRSASFTVGK